MGTRFTLREWKTLPEGFPAQLFDGQLVCEPSPTYRHQDLVTQLLLLLVPVFGRRHVVVSPTDVVLDDTNVLQPDVAVLRRLPPEDSHDVGIPHLVFEVLSPSTAERDRDVKTKKFLDAGVAEVWLVDPETETLEIRAGGAGARRFAGDERARSYACPGLSLTARDVFARG